MYQRMLGDQMLNEEYYIAMNKIFKSQDCRRMFVDMLVGLNSNDPKTNNKSIWVSRACF
jgi:hypothetical protein